MAQDSILRILDANANRAREALRVLEDVARFALNDAELTEGLKILRHDFAGILAGLPMDRAMLARDTPGDVGTGIGTAAEARRESLGAVATAAGKRLSEALRAIEECAKTLDADAAGRVEALRYRGYALEQAVARHAELRPATERFARVRLYVLLTESFCGARGWEETLEAILQASPGNGRVAVQLREKQLEDVELLRRAKVLARRCREAGVVSIVNDRADVALLSGADGVHLGQGDLPVEEVRRVVGVDMIVGVSTERLEQGRAAVRAGATYVAVGPMFETRTKAKPRIAGVAYAVAAAEELRAPVVPIGGITLENVGQLTGQGVGRAAVCAAVIGAADVAAAVRAFLEKLG